jgi:hypothetical protein
MLGNGDPKGSLAVFQEVGIIVCQTFGLGAGGFSEIVRWVGGQQWKCLFAPKCGSRYLVQQWNAVAVRGQHGDIYVLTCAWFAVTP